MSLELALAGTFVDDEGTTHTIPENAKIVTGAMDAVAFYHFGMNSDHIVATIGERSTSGSNFGGTYFDGNLVFGDINHGASPHDPDIFPADPNTEERAFLDSIPGDLSSECSATNYYCDKVNMDYLNKNGWPDVIVVGSFYNGLVNDEFMGNATEKNIPVVKLTDTYEDSTEEMAPRDMVAMIERMEEIAMLIGVDKSASTMVDNDKKALCEEAAKFQVTAEKAHELGVRSMASYMPYMDNLPGVTGAFIPNPDRDAVLTMMQNLGMPILYNEHSGSYWEGRAGSFVPNDGNFIANNTASLSGVPYHVDFWLYDDRITLDFLSEEWKEHWPHPAVVAGQHAPWQANGRIFSYRHATEILSITGTNLGKAKSLFPATECTPVDEDMMAATGGQRGLTAGQYSCLKVVPIDFCEALMEDKSSASSMNSFLMTVLVSIGAITYGIL